ncbi:ArsR/SmtB family transcription factor [Streptomyces sp. NPDC004609]|uniref:ArsR/SmtB family transcription factor n=1 Tax=Streptomyces sp. NPDC004609 TaxID=3364704 RepID=UPI00367F1F98
MDLEERVAELERRLGALEKERAEAPSIGEGPLWALEGLKEQLAGIGAGDGGVMFTGAVRLPTHERYEWQYGALTEELLEGDWSDAAESFAALGHPVRLRLLREILAGRRTVAELTEPVGLGTTGKVYHHLRQLTSTGWLHIESRGRYEVPAARVVPLLVVLTAACP